MANNRITNLSHIKPGDVIGISHVNDMIGNTYSLQERVEKIEKRLAILEAPDKEKLEKFPALQEAYEHYLFVEKLVENE